MKFLIDNALSPLLARLLGRAGHDAIHVRDIERQTAADDEILTLAKAEDRVIVSADTDFGMLLALGAENRPSFILFRQTGNRRPERQAQEILANLPAVEGQLIRGCVVVLEDTRMRVRPLPIGGIE